MTASLTAVFVGDISLDGYHALSRWPGLGEKAPVRMLAPQVGGTIANAACCLAGFGDHVELVWALNDGTVAHRLRAHLEAAGVGTRWLATDPDLPDSRTLVFLVDGEHTVLLPDFGDIRIPVVAPLLSAMRAADILYTNGIEARRLHRPGSDATGADILREVRDGGTLVALDIDVDADDDAHLSAADIVFTNRLGVSRLAGDASPGDVARRLFARGLGLLVVTRGAEGATVHTHDGDIHLPGLRVDAVDVTGAGDTFGAAFVHAFALTRDPDLAGRFATAAAARATTILGPQAGVAGVAEVLAFMEAHRILDPGDAGRLTPSVPPDPDPQGDHAPDVPHAHGAMGAVADRASLHALSPREKS